MKKLFLGAIAGFALLAITMTASAQSQAVSRVIVVGHDGVSLSTIHGLVASENGQHHRDLVARNAVVAFVPSARVDSLRNAPGVLRVEYDVVMEAIGGRWCSPWPSCKNDDGGEEPPPEPSQVTPWGITATGGNATGFTGAGVNVVVIDTGIDVNHPDLNVVGGINFTKGRSNKYSDDNGHGTHVAGTIAALDNDFGVIGMAPDANLYACKALDRNGSGWLSDVVACIDWAVANGMNVINMSLGASSGTQTMEDACNDAEAAGLLIYAAAGNSGDGDPLTDEVGYPAAYASVIAVAAVDSNLDVAYFSSDGPEVESASPGVNVLSTIRGGGYQDGWSGTSMAAPHNAGAGALLMEAYPALDNYCLRSHQQSAAVDLGDPGLDRFYGHGFMDVPAVIASAAAGCL